MDFSDIARLAADALDDIAVLLAEMSDEDRANELTITDLALVSIAASLYRLQALPASRDQLELGL
jgi:hypothetical protein